MGNLIMVLGKSGSGNNGRKADFFAADQSTATVAPWEMDEATESNDVDASNVVNGSEPDSASANISNNNSESVALNQFSFNLKISSQINYHLFTLL